jgi:formiminoglutamate deiminase
VTPPTTYVLEHAWLPGTDGLGEVHADVAVTVVDGRIATVEPVSESRAERPVRLGGLTLPGFANGHSHAFHRALRSRAQAGQGSFWTWREQMYDLAGRLDPDGYRELATAVFREMAAAGYTAVGEFHYLHHQPDGSSYDDPNVMAEALVAAAGDAGVRLALLDTCYLSSGLAPDGGSLPVEGVQLRFSDGTAEAWQERADELTAELGGDVVVGAALHSVRAVPLRDMRLVAEWADRFETPLHVHLSEQVAENEQCLAAYGRTPTEVLDEAGVLTDRTTAVHATHLTGTDVGRLGANGCYACFCPTTERDLGDGIGPSRALAEVGAHLTVGSDSHAVIDPFEELRGVELDHRLLEQSRGHWRAAELLRAGTVDGHRSLGFGDAGRIAPGAHADLVSIDLDSARTAGGGATPENALFAATAADVRHVVSGGRVVFDGDHASVGRDLAAVVARLWEES